MAVDICLCKHPKECHSIGPSRKCEHCACTHYHSKSEV